MSCKAPVKSSHHQQTNTKFFLQAGCPSCRPTNSVKALKGNITFQGLAYPKLTLGLPTLSLTTNSSRLPWRGLHALITIIHCCGWVKFTNKNNQIKFTVRLEFIISIFTWYFYFLFIVNVTIVHYYTSSTALMQPSFSGLFVTWAYFPATTTTTTKLILTASFQDTLCKPVPECLTILDFAAVRDDGRSDGGDNHQDLQSSVKSSLTLTFQSTVSQQRKQHITQYHMHWFRSVNITQQNYEVSSRKKYYLGNRFTRHT